MEIVDKYYECPSKVTLSQNVKVVNFYFLLMNVLFIVLLHVTVLSNRYMEYYHCLGITNNKLKLLCLPFCGVFIIYCGLLVMRAGGLSVPCYFAFDLTLINKGLY